MMTMRTVPVTEMPGVALLPRRVFEDDRGSFTELFNARALAPIVGENVSFVQDNHSRSRPQVLRGLHYQVRQVQGKLLHVARGRIFDVVVDLRQRSPTFGRWYGCVLDAAQPQHLWVPPGLAHGFVALTEAEVVYKVTDYWLSWADTPKFDAL